MNLIQFRNAVRKAVSNYMKSEGCSCCRNIEDHKKNEAELARLLNVPKYSDGSGYDFTKFRSKVNNNTV
jgi:hypothetical protein